MVAHLSRLRPSGLVALVFTAIAATAIAQSDLPRRAGDRWEPGRLRRVIEERYRVAPLQDGVALVPRRESQDVKSIEISGDSIAINGTPVTGAELRERLASDADAILALSYLDPAGRRALFEPPPEAGARPSPAAGARRPTAAPETETAPPPAGELPERAAGREPRGIRSDARVHIGRGVQVDENESVDGPVVAIGGSVTVNGEVRRDVVAIGGNVHLGPKARVLGDVTAVGGTVERDPHAEIDGRINEIGFDAFRHMRSGRSFLAGALEPWVALLATMFRMVLVGVLAFLVLVLARNPVARIERTVAVEPWKAGLVGVLTQLLFIPVFVLTIIILAVSIVGIPLLLFVPPLAILAFIAAFVVGFTAVAYRLGRWGQARFGWRAQNPFLLLLLGLLGIWSLTLAGRIVWLGGWPVWIVSTLLLVVGFMLEYVAWTVGLGAAVITRLGTRPGGGAVAPAAAAASPGPQAGGTV